VVGKARVKQSHIAGNILFFLYPVFTTFFYSETEKYAHVTFFFNGGVEKQFEEESRHMIPSPKVATYDKQPAMSVQGVADKVIEVLAKGDQDFVMCNFAPPDMVRFL
jgi:2,3-bisphosphoglycerate-independent phosphoglycerate mutase